MNSEDRKKIDTCLQELAEILYRNTPSEELADFEGIEKAVRNHMLETVGPNIGFFYQNQDRNGQGERTENQKYAGGAEIKKKAVIQTRNGRQK
jgi:hypothetical protein